MKPVETSQIPILLTSSVIVHDTGVRLQDPKDRARLALESICKWRAIAPSNPLVLCDGSGFDFTSMLKELNDMASVECLYFQNDVPLVKQYGRGYGEGEIVRYAIENSKSIQSVGAFAKCTSKLWVENFRECTQLWNGQLLLKGVFDNVFSPSKKTALGYIDTRFYVADIEYYRTHFLNAHETVRSNEGYGLEESFKDVFLIAQMQSCLMYPPPVICGVGGGTGTYYKNTYVRRQKEKLRYELVKLNPLFRSWFT